MLSPSRRAAFLTAVSATALASALASAGPAAGAAPTAPTTPPAQTAPTARAASTATLTRTSSLRGGPEFLDGGRIAWLEASAAGWSIRAVTPGYTKAQTIASGALHHVVDNDESGDVSDDEISDTFAAAGDTAVVELGYVVGSTKTQTYRTGTEIRAYNLTASTHRTLDTCGGQSEGYAPSAPRGTFSTDGIHTAVSLCTDTMVFDRTGTKPVATLPGVSAKVELAGPYLAALRSGRIDVIDWATGAVLYGTTIPSAGDPAFDFDLQDDGALAIATVPTAASGIPARLTWHTPSTPDGTVLPVTPMTATVSVGGGKAVTSTASLSGLGGVLTEIGPTAPDLPLAFLGWNAPGGLGYRDGAVAFARAGCNGAGVVAVADGDATPVATVCPDLEFQRAKRSGRRLTVTATHQAGLLEDFTLTFRARGKTFRRSIASTPTSHGLRATVRLPAWATGTAGVATLGYPGDPQFVRQAANRDVRR